MPLGTKHSPWMAVLKSSKQRDALRGAEAGATRLSFFGGMMSNKRKDAKLAWKTMRQDELCQYLIVVLKKTIRWAESSSHFSDDPEGVVNFMWGRVESNYQLFVRGREYKASAVGKDV